MKIACIQMTSGPDIGTNLDDVEKAVREAASQGAVFIATPENTDFMCADRSEKMQKAYAAAEHPALRRFTDLAKELDHLFLAIALLLRKAARWFFLLCPNRAGAPTRQKEKRSAGHQM